MNCLDHNAGKPVMVVVVGGGGGGGGEDIMPDQTEICFLHPCIILSTIIIVVERL